MSTLVYENLKYVGSLKEPILTTREFRKERFRFLVRRKI